MGKECDVTDSSDSSINFDFALRSCSLFIFLLGHYPCHRDTDITIHSYRKRGPLALEHSDDELDGVSEKILIEIGQHFR